MDLARPTPSSSLAAGAMSSTAKASLSKMQTAGRSLTFISKTYPCVVASRNGLTVPRSLAGRIEHRKIAPTC